MNNNNNNLKTKDETDVQNWKSTIRSRSITTKEQQQQQQQQQTTEEETQTIIQRMTHIGSVVLENNGAVARDHLANERTFLAWLRTSISFATMGVGIVQLFKLSSTGETPTYLTNLFKALGCMYSAGVINIWWNTIFSLLITTTTTVICVSIAIIVLGFGISRFFMVQNLLQVNKFPASRLSVLFLSIVTSSITILVLVALVLVERSHSS